jgi:hypothetical protein
MAKTNQPDTPPSPPQKQSLRAKRAAEYERRQRQRRLTYGLIGAGVVIVVLMGAWVISNQGSPENVILPDPIVSPASADGSAWGPVGAAVLVEEYSDFQ